MPIVAITFDFWQTLYKSRPIDIEARLQEMQVDLAHSSGHTFPLAQVRAASNAARIAWGRAWVTEHRTLTAADWLTIMLTELKLTLPPAEQQRITRRMEEHVLQERPTLTPEAAPVLADLAKKYRLGIISDTGIVPGRVLRQLLQEDDISQYFSRLTFSDELGYSKPHPRAFMATLTALEAAPDQAVHIGDLLRTDIAGAQKAGMRSVQYTGISTDDWSLSQADPSAEPVQPDAVINHHGELLPLLARWNGRSAA